jgi:uncharacterized protein (TIGR03435 family)
MNEPSSNSANLRPPAAPVWTLENCRVTILFLAVALLAGMARPLRMARAQTPHPPYWQAPSFEVASIRPSASDDGKTNFSLAPERFSVENAPLSVLIQFAYDIKSDDQLPKTPGWIGSKNFDVDAKVADTDVKLIKELPSDQKLDQYRLMVRSLLEERFNLKVSRQEKELPVYALVLAKGRPKAALVVVSQESQMHRTPTLGGSSHGVLNAGAVSMALFADWLSGRGDIGGRPVIDATGLHGSFDFTLDLAPTGAYVPNDAGTGPVNAAPDAPGPSLLTAVQEQLGLKLEPRRTPVEVLVIDHVDLPSPN